ncbi:MAG: hypothetical protein ACX98W_22320 [bacterium]
MAIPRNEITTSDSASSVVSDRDNDDVRAELAALAEEFKATFAQSEAINDKRRAIRSAVKEMGIIPAEFVRACRMSQLDPEQRAGVDESMLICRKAIGHPVQTDMFSDSGEASAGLTH